MFYLLSSIFIRNFASTNPLSHIKMTAVQLNAEIYRAMGVIAEDEGLLARAAKYLKKLAAQKEDSTLMSKEEFYANIDKAEEQYARGEYTTQLPGESVSDMLKRCGYAL
jgi:tetratricopeptide (TPR) repeat protein